MSFLSTLFGEEAEIKTQTVTDPLKQAVATPLSSYLSSSIGEGLPRYSGQLYSQTATDTGLTYGGGGSLSDFLSLNSNDFFTKYVEEPTTANWKKNILPVITEGYAGAMSGSGRYSAQSASASDLASSLAEQRAELAVSLPQAQYEITSGMRQQDFDIATAIKEQNDANLALEYADWYKSLPENNPLLSSALSFLSSSTSTGTDILSYLYEGSEGLMGDIIKALGTIGAAAAA